MSGKSEEGKIVATFIIEVLGRPKEHLTATLEDLTRKIGEEKNVRILNKKINEPKPVEKQKDLFTAFAEVEVEVDEAMMLAAIMFKYMPSHVEIVEPEKLVLTNNGFSEILSEITRRLHRYEELVKVLQFQQAQAKEKNK